MTAITITDLENAAQDVATIGSIANSTSPTVTDRLGQSRPTMTALAAEYPAASANAAAALVSKTAARVSETNAMASKVAAESARDSINTTGKVFTSAEGTAAGIAATANGQQFAVLSADGLSWLIYRNNAGSALAVGPGTYTKAHIDAMDVNILRGLLSRTAGPSNRMSGRTSTLINTLRTIEVSNLAATSVTALFFCVRLQVDGVAYPSVATDSAAFGTYAFNVKAFNAAGTLMINQNMTRLAGTDIWYYRSTTLPTQDTNSLKVEANQAAGAGVTHTLSQPFLVFDAGYPNTEPDVRNSAISSADLTSFERSLLAVYRDAAASNFLTTKAGTITTGGTLQLTNAVAQTLTAYSAACVISVDGTYPTLGTEINLKAEVFRGAGVLSASAFMTRIGTSNVWYAKDIPAGTGPHTSAKIVANVPAGSTTMTCTDAVFTSGGLPLPLNEHIASAVASSPIHRPKTALQAIAAAALQRVAFVCMGDSNQVKDGYGFTGGFMKKLAAAYGQYATAVQSSGYSGPANVSTESATGFGAMTGAGAAVDALFPGGYAYIASDVNFTDGANGFGISADSPMGVSNALRAHYSWVSADAGAGQFRMGVRQGDAPYATLVNGPLTSTNTGAVAVQRQYVDIPAAARTTGLEIKFYNPGGTAITGPFVGLYTQFENVAKLNGVCVSTLYAAGGQSLWDMASTLLTRANKDLSVFFAEVRRLQLSAGQKPIVVVYINSGLNDKNETSVPSWGWRAGTVGDSTTNYIDNLEAISKRITDIWQINKWDVEELFFLVVPSHPIATPDDSELVAYRKAAFSWASGRQRTSFVDFANLTNSTEMLALGYYMDDGVDRNHLTLSGYDTLAERVVSLAV